MDSFGKRYLEKICRFSLDSSKNYWGPPLLTISRHSGLPRNTSSNDNNVRTSKSLPQASILGKVAADLGFGVDVHQICRDTWNVHDIVK